MKEGGARRSKGSARPVGIAIPHEVGARYFQKEES